MTRNDTRAASAGHLDRGRARRRYRGVDATRKSKETWSGMRSCALAAVWVLVLARLVAELGGRGAPFLHHDLRQLFAEQEVFYAQGHVLTRSIYPAYAFWLAVPWLPPGLSWVGTRLWFASCQLVSVAVILAFAWREGRSAGTRGGWLLVGAVLAMTGLRADLLFGNYSVLMTALLVLAGAAAARERWGLAAAIWLATLLKPQMGWLFGFFFAGRGWRWLVAVFVLVAGLTWAGCAWSGMTVLDWWESRYSTRLADTPRVIDSVNVLSLAGALGIDRRVALVASAVAGVVAAGAAWAGPLRAAEWGRRLAFLGVVNRACTYHNACDDLLLVFALAWLGRRAWGRNGWCDWAWFLLLGATVWAPTAVLQAGAVRIAAMLIWLAVAIALVWERERNGASEAAGVARTA